MKHSSRVIVGFLTLSLVALITIVVFGVGIAMQGTAERSWSAALPGVLRLVWLPLLGIAALAGWTVAALNWREPEPAAVEPTAAEPVPPAEPPAADASLDIDALLTLDQILARSLDADVVVPPALAALGEATQADVVSCIIIRPEDGAPRAYGTHGADSADRFQQITHVLYRHMREIDTLRLDSASEIGAYTGDSAGLGGIVATALRDERRIQGVIWVGYVEAVPPPAAQLVPQAAGRIAAFLTRARVAAAAERGYRQMAGVLASTREPIAVIDSTDRFILINRAMEKAFDLNNRAVTQRAVRDVVRRADLRDVLLADAATVKGRQIPLVAAVERDSGRSIDLALQNDVPLYSLSAAEVTGQDGRSIGRVVVFHDMTQSVSQVKTQLVQTLAHDIRRELAQINSALYFARRGDLTAEQSQALTQIGDHGDRIGRVLTELLDLDRIRAGGLLLEPVAIDTLLHEIWLAYTRRAGQQGGSLARDATTGCIVMGDSSLLRTAIDNLLELSLRRTAGQGTITLGAQREAERVVVYVADEGPGLPRSDLPRAFDRYQRASRVPYSSEFGTSLAIPLAIAEKHGGRAWVERDLGVGTRYLLALPLADAVDGPAAAGPAK